MQTLNSGRQTLTATVERIIKKWNPHLNRDVWSISFKDIRGIDGNLLIDAYSVGYSNKWWKLGELQKGTKLSFRAVVIVDGSEAIGFTDATCIRRVL